MRALRMVGALTVCGIAWGLTIPLTKVAVSTGHQPLGLIFWQLVVGTVALGAISIARGVPLPLDRRALGYFLVIGLIGTIVPNTFTFLSVSHLPAGVMAIAIASVPMFALAIATTIRIERLEARRAGGVLLGAAAVALLLGPEASLPEPEKAVFVLVALIAPACYGAEANYIAARAPPEVDAITTLLGASALGAVVAWPLALGTGGWVDLSVTWGEAEWALLAASLCHVTAYTIYVWLVGAAGAVFAAQVSYLVTISAVLLSALLLGEAYSGWVWLALVVMIGGLALVQPRAPPAALAHEAAGETPD